MQPHAGHLLIHSGRGAVALAQAVGFMVQAPWGAEGLVAQGNQGSIRQWQWQGSSRVVAPWTLMERIALVACCGDTIHERPLVGGRL
jgi:hypothetical protein